MNYAEMIEKFRTEWNSIAHFRVGDVTEVMQISWDDAWDMIMWANGECIIAAFSYGYQFTDA